eukprot:266606-Rhodomonas_salina.1
MAGGTDRGRHVGAGVRARDGLPLCRGPARQEKGPRKGTSKGGHYVTAHAKRTKPRPPYTV